MVTLTQAIECIEQGKIRAERINSKDVKTVTQNRINEESLETILKMLKSLKTIHTNLYSHKSDYYHRLESGLLRAFIGYPKLCQPIEEGQVVTFNISSGHQVTIKVDSVLHDESYNITSVEGVKASGLGRAGFTYSPATLEDRVVSIDGIPLADWLTH